MLNTAPLKLPPDPADHFHMTDVERTNAELRAALIIAGKRIQKLNFGRKNDPALPISCGA